MSRLFNIKRIALILYLQIQALATAGALPVFVEFFPVARIASRNFKTESVDRLSYLEYLDQPRLLNLGFDYEFAGLHLYLAFDFFKNLEADSKNFAFSNIPVTKHGFNGSANNNWPSASYLEYHRSWLSLSAGRRKLAVGYGDYSLMAGAQAPYYDGVFFGFHPDLPNTSVKPFYYFIGAADDQKGVEDYLKANVDPNDPAKYAQKTRWFFVHKAGISWRNMRFALAESSVVYGRPLTFWNSNPFTVWHNTYSNGVNVALSLTGEGLIGPVRIYGEFYMDDLRLGVEDPETNPSAFGAYLGADWQLIEAAASYEGPLFGAQLHALREESFKRSGGVSVSLQAAYASAYLYSRSENDPLGKIAFFNSMQLGVGHWTQAEYYLGLPYGPDTIMLEAGAQYEESRWKAEGQAVLLLQGKHAAASGFGSQAQNLFNALYTDDWAYSGVKDIGLLINLKGYYAVNKHISAYAALRCRLKLNNISASRASLEAGAGFHF